MLRYKKENTNIGVGLGLVIQLSKFILVNRGIISPDAGSAVWVLGTLIFVWGCMNYAEGKGASKSLGWLGLLSVIGLLILFFLPDRYKDEDGLSPRELPKTPK